MASDQDIKEIYAQEKKVVPGWTYCKSSNKFYPTDSTFKVETAITYNLITLSGKILKNFQESKAFENQLWVKDLGTVDVNNVFLTKGTKILRKKGCNISPHSICHTVSTVNYKCFVDMLVIFSQPVADDDKNKMGNILYKVLYENSEVLIPDRMLKTFNCAYIYSSWNKANSVMMTSFKSCMEEFCNILKKTKLSNIPLTVLLMNPKHVAPPQILGADKCLTEDKASTPAKTIVKEECQLQNTRTDAEESRGQIRYLNETTFNSEDCSRSSGWKHQVQVELPVDTQLPQSNNTCQASSHHSNVVQDLNLQSNAITHSYSDVGHITYSSSKVTPSKSLLKPVSRSASNLQNQTQCNPLLNSDGESGIKAVQLSDSQTVADKFTEDCKAAFGNKLGEIHMLCNKMASDVAKHRLSTGSEKQCVSVKNINSKTNPCASVTNFAKPSEVSGKWSQVTQTHSSPSKFPSSGAEKKMLGTQSNKQNKFCRDEKNSKLQTKKIKKDDSVPTQNKPSKIITSNYREEHQFTNQNAREIHGKVRESIILPPTTSCPDPCGMKRKFYGVVSTKVKEKVLILIGASGSGKTTLLNFIANCIKGVKTVDEELIYVEGNSKEAPCHTTSITAYTFCFLEDDIPITIIDTPGLKNSSGADVNDYVQSLKTFITNAASQSLDIHAIGFVAQAHQVHLTSSELFIIDYVSKLYGQGVINHFIPFITCADNQKTPLVIEAMKNYGVKSKFFFKFNNFVLSRTSTQEIDDMDRIFWKTGNKNWRKCKQYLLELPALSVNTFKAIQSEVYATTVMDSAVRDLKSELKKFLNSCQDFKHMTKEAFKICENVWEFAAVVHHLKCTQESDTSDVKSILITCTDEMCKENAFPSKDCVKLLSLAPSKSLLGAGIGAIRSLGPLYEQVKISETKESETMELSGIFFCKKCQEDHRIERQTTSGILNLLSSIGTSSNIITLKCTDCKCGGVFHVKATKRKQQASVDLSSGYLLNHIEKVINNILQKWSLSGRLIGKNQYLYHINLALDHKFRMLIDDLLSVK
ncbi:uncharacterized protein LOC121872931 isoform X2 [Homarus americanus]|uniref:uncharacterized protein LOC121872931 isoform X2 n=1 Tax=Homarus americanus TaxID=6706 RepID=UPI001C438E59|nr:uncharacterized protein LOC121872931 isoform X2 [Homarus americanus]XP_042231999.1 uncharacterized protein LOC121872931 isoform X2 [Homarus americanus]